MDADRPVRAPGLQRTTNPQRHPEGRVPRPGVPRPYPPSRPTRAAHLPIGNESSRSSSCLTQMQGGWTVRHHPYQMQGGWTLRHHPYQLRPR